MLHMRCCARILNLIVKDGELEAVISSIKNVAKYARGCWVEFFKESCKEVNIESKALLSLDVVTRWNSTYMMLEVVLKFKNAFKNLESDANYTKYFDCENTTQKKIDGPPQNLDWDQAEVYHLEV